MRTWVQRGTVPTPHRAAPCDPFGRYVPTLAGGVCAVGVIVTVPSLRESITITVLQNGDGCKLGFTTVGPCGDWAAFAFDPGRRVARSHSPFDGCTAHRGASGDRERRDAAFHGHDQCSYPFSALSLKHFQGL